MVQALTDRYRTQARWHKAVQHLREAGTLTDSPKDIGPLILEIPADVLKECEGEIKDTLFAWAWPHIRRGLTAGMPQWYKDLLTQSAFPDKEV